MVRRSTAERDPQPPMYAAESPLGTADAGQAAGPGKRAGTWRGAGGRWMVWFFRAILWAVIIIVGYRGVLAIVASETGRSPAGSAAKPAAGGEQFPVALADAYALQFAQAYLNVSPATASQRAQQLSAFLPAGADPNLGWNGAGQLSLQSEQIAGNEVQDAHNAVVTILARVNNTLMELGVPVYTADGAIVVSGEPAWLPAPAKAVPPQPGTPSSDEAAQTALGRQLPAFFQAYASGDPATLSRFAAPGASLTGLGGAVQFSSISSISVPPGGNVRHIVAAVVWQVPGQGGTAAQFEMSYAMTVVDENGNWNVADILASTQPAGSS